jgi:hypothetical protein
MEGINKYQYRCQIISLLDRKFCTAKKAAQELNLSEKHIRKILSKFRKSKLSESLSDFIKSNQANFLTATANRR